MKNKYTWWVSFDDTKPDLLLNEMLESLKHKNLLADWK